MIDKNNGRTMKPLMMLLGCLLCMSTFAFGQSAHDSTRKQESRRSRGMADENGDGINDRMIGRQQMIKKGLDRFIDTNGDGISDTRECAFGFRRGGMQQTESGKQGMGKGQKGK
jgi:hypothetical protein